MISDANASGRLYKLKESTPALPDRLYKFTALKYARKIIEFGLVRVGTLFEYRRADQYGGDTLDREEGILRHTHRILKAHGGQLGALQPLGIHVDPDYDPGRIIFRNVTTNMQSSESDLYLYCCSVSDEWNSSVDAAYDTCVEIHKPILFFEELLLALERKGYGTGKGSAEAVQYAGRTHTTNVDAEVHIGGPPTRPSMLKGIQHEKQREFRMIFEPSALPIEPKIIMSRKISNCCRIHSRRPNEAALNR